jgi:hypothetical protein
VSVATVPVPGEPFLRYSGGAAAKPAEQQDTPAFLAALNRVGQALNRVIDIFSGSGGPDVRGGGFAGDPHDLRIAADATINGVPIGQYPGAVAAIHAQGLRSGATDFTYQGKPDYAHVDAVNDPSLDLTKNSPGTSTGGTIQTADDFWYEVEKQLGLPHDRATHAFLVSWATAEGTTAQNNPLATTLKLPGSTGLSGNPDGVQQYATPEQGATATADTIKKYPSIVTMLRRGVSYQSASSPGVVRELNIWSGQRSAGAKLTDYVSNILANYQGNPTGKSGSDWLSTTGGVGAAASAVAGAAKDAVSWTASAAKVLGKLLDPSTWRRFGLMLAGGVLIIAGLGWLAHSAGVPLPKVVPLPV